MLKERILKIGLNVSRAALFGLSIGVSISMGILLSAPVQAQNAAQDGDEDGASVIMYHRFGENDFPTTNVRLEQFEAHIQELTSGDYTVLAIPEIVRRLKAGERFPEKTIGITIDDAYLSVFTEAWPRFKKAGLPFTIFVATDPIERKFSRYMSWAQLRELSRDPLVTIGSQTASHLHMIDTNAERLGVDLTVSNDLFKKELGHVPQLIAYPYGEFDNHVIEASKKAGFVAGFGQHSGAFGLGDDVYRLPRFAMNEHYGNLTRLKTAASALPIQVSDFDPTDTVVTSDRNPPLIGFTVTNETNRIKEIACFSNHEGKLTVEHLGPRIEVRMKKPLPQGRTRLNCTLPTGPSGEGRFRWLGKLFYVK
ncbi:MAG: chitin deacetylase [Rhodospirillaceae bacterium]|nr:MAG: chitin deacetylase [Rhodospirillaceae bacterium]